MSIFFTDTNVSVEAASALTANLSAIVLDFVARHKVGGTNLNFFIAKQLPVLPGLANKLVLSWPTPPSFHNRCSARCGSEW